DEHYQETCGKQELQTDKQHMTENTWHHTERGIKNVNPKKSQIILQETCIKAFYSLIQMARIHRENNRLLIDSARNFVRVVVLLGSDKGSLTVRFIDKRIWLQERKLLYRPETSNLFDDILRYFEKRGVFGFRFHIGIRKASFKQLMTFIHLLKNSEQQKSPRDWLLRQLKARGFSWVELLNKPVANQEDRKERAKRSYLHVLASVREISQKLSCGQQAGLTKSIRVIQNMVDLIMEDDPLFRALSTVRIYDDYTFVHSVNVAILSMCMGKRIMLSRKSMERLGLCALLHDLGKLEIPKGILNKPAKLTDEEFEVMKKHSLISVLLITKIQTDRDRKADILLPPFEHHLKYDLSGYPQTSRKKEVSLFGRIITIADVYDAITSPRIYRPTTLSPDRALGLMLEGAGKDFDPILLKVFINMLGVYPVGTLLKLDKGVGLVTETPVSDCKRPRVVLLKRDKKGKITKGETADLSEHDPQTGEYRINIVRSLNPADYNIQPAEFLL
ncbi:HD-GYP domain-containing protein, partial [Desulfobacterales bacterium HSG2]|nr:HD-GYP domain-containing protein [Desulfobacterales bacterium HSG2]